MNKGLLLLLLIITFNIYANPAPLGFELNKATISEVEKLHKITKKEKNYWEGYNYHLDIKDVKLEGIREVLVICNDVNIIQAVILTISNNKFSEFYESLSEKYKSIKENLSNFASKEVQFVNNNCTIILDAPTLSFEMSLIYITNEFLTRFRVKQHEERLLMKTKDKELL